MGYSQDCSVHLEIPTAKIEAATALVRERFALYWVGVPPESMPVLDPDNELGEGLLQLLGEGGDIELFQEIPVATPGCVVLSGASWGKSGYEDESILREFAALGITGTVDVVGEDSTIWRWRLRGGDLIAYTGIVVFPDDPEDTKLADYHAAQ